MAPLVTVFYEQAMCSVALTHWIVHHTKHCFLSHAQVIVYHPRQLSPEQVMERVHKVSSSSTLWNTAKAVVATLMLPVAWGVDILVIPGPSVSVSPA